MMIGVNSAGTVAAPHDGAAIAIVGPGDVGLSIAAEFEKWRRIAGFISTRGRPAMTANAVLLPWK